jgi:hypothetical protein
VRRLPGPVAAQFGAKSSVKFTRVNLECAASRRNPLRSEIERHVARPFGLHERRQVKSAFFEALPGAPPPEKKYRMRSQRFARFRNNFAPFV